MNPLRAQLQRARARWRAMPRVRIIAWALLAATLCGVTGFLEPVDDGFRNLRFQARSAPAGDRIVVVGIDQESLTTIGGTWPWPRSNYAILVARLKNAGANKIVFDRALSDPDTAENDRRFNETLKRHAGDVYLGVGFGEGLGGHYRNLLMPHQNIRPYAKLASFRFKNNAFRQADQVFMEISDENRTYPSLSTVISRQRPQLHRLIRPDYAIRTETFPFVSAGTIISGKPFSIPKGADVLIGDTATVLGDIKALPGQGLRPGVYVHAIAAQTLLRGMPSDYGWAPPVLFAAAISLVLLRSNRNRSGALLVLSAVAALCFFPVRLDASLIQVEIAPALLAISIVSIQNARMRTAWLNSRKNEASGLGNAFAFRELEDKGAGAVVAARVDNYAAIIASFAADVEAAFVKAIVDRLSASDASLQIHQADDGVFYWIAPQATANAIEDHLSGLRALFNQPLYVRDRRIDVAISLGADHDPSRSIASRCGSALLAAQHAGSRGWSVYDPASGANAEWELSIASEIDRGIEAEQFWLAYQPKMDLRTGLISGAEILLRWSHPSRGEISPVEFIPAAERSGRINRLTHYVLLRAVAAAWRLSDESAGKLAVNISVPVLAQSNFVAVLIAMCRRQRVDPSRLMLEITESNLVSAGDAQIEATLNDLRRLGFGLSIDDFGTGFSSLDYVRRIPANEMKVDQTFVRTLTRDAPEKVVIESVLHMAHELGRRVVAEGVETQEALDVLREMGVDEAQGYLIGRPAEFAVFLDMLDKPARNAA